MSHQFYKLRIIGARGSAGAPGFACDLTNAYLYRRMTRGLASSPMLIIHAIAKLPQQQRVRMIHY